MATFSVKEKFEKNIKQIWDNTEFDNIPIKQYGYASQDKIEKESLMFIGINPSNSLKDKWSGFYNNYQERTDETHKYFHKFIEISQEVNLYWSHIDLLFVRWTNQKEVEQIIFEEKGVNFLWEQLLVSKQIIEETKPKIIVVNNSFARRLLGFEKYERNGKSENVWLGIEFEFDKNIGTHKISNNEILNGTPVFFTSMLTGQRALDKGSYERLIWHINYVKNKL